MTKDEVRELIEQFYTGAEREYLLDAVDVLPLTSSDEIRTERGTTIGSRPFERPLDPENMTPDRVSLPTEFRIQGSGAAITSRWIKNHLLAVETDYPYRMWKRYNVFRVRRVPENVVENGEVKPANTYDSFQGRISMLRQLDVMDRTEQREASTRGFQRTYYEVTDPDNPAWDDPQGTLYPGTTPATFKDSIERLRDTLNRDPTVEEVAEEVGISAAAAASRMEAWDIDLRPPERFQ